MRLCTYKEYEGHAAGVMVNGRVASLEDLNDAWDQDFGPDLGTLIKRRRAWDLAAMLDDAPRPVYSGWRPESLTYLAPYRNPPKIVGIGLNYAEHAADLAATRPDDPASFIKPATTITDPAKPLHLPTGVGRVTGEGELAVVMGERLKDAATAEEAREAVLGFTTAIDLTALDVLQQNPRSLTRSKAFDQFLVFGPWLVTRDEWEPAPETVVRTTAGGKTHVENEVRNMNMSPYDLVAYHSRVFAWEPGDVLLTGTPGAVTLTSGLTVGCDVDGLGSVTAPVA